MWVFYRPQSASVSTAGSTARPGGVSIRGLLKLEKHSATVCTSASCPAELKLTSSSHTPERASGADRNTHSDTTQQSSTHFCDTHTLSLGSRALVWVSVCKFVSSFLSLFLFALTSLPFFQPAITARPCHLFSILWNATLPAVHSHGAKNWKVTKKSLTAKNTKPHRKGRHTRFEPGYISIARDFPFLFHFLNVRYYLFQHILTACFYLRNRNKLSLKCLSWF